MPGRPRRSILLILITLLGGLTGYQPASRAHEPDGAVVFDAEGPVAPPENALGFVPGDKMIRLTIRSVRDLDGVVLTHQAPEGVVQRLANIRSTGSAARAIDPHEGASPARLEIGALKAGVPVLLEFAEDFAEGSGGVVTFTIEGIGADGKIYREALGHVVGTPGTHGVERNGAIEFPAHQMDPEEKP